MKLPCRLIVVLCGACVGSSKYISENFSDAYFSKVGTKRIKTFQDRGWYPDFMSPELYRIYDPLNFQYYTPNLSAKESCIPNGTLLAAHANYAHTWYYRYSMEASKAGFDVAVLKVPGAPLWAPEFIPPEAEVLLFDRDMDASVNTALNKCSFAMTAGEEWSKEVWNIEHDRVMYLHETYNWPLIKMEI